MLSRLHEGVDPPVWVDAVQMSIISARAVTDRVQSRIDEASRQVLCAARVVRRIRMLLELSETRQRGHALPRGRGAYGAAAVNHEDGAHP